jgi:hypothetical protein
VFDGLGDSVGVSSSLGDNETEAERDCVGASDLLRDFDFCCERVADLDTVRDADGRDETDSVNDTA